MANPPTTGRRIKAAMALAGYSIEELSEAIDQRGLGPRTLRKLQDDADPREARAWELRAIAEACDLPYAWFTVESFADALDDARGRDGRVSPEERLAELEAARDASEAHREALGASLSALAAEMAVLRRELRARKRDA